MRNTLILSSDSRCITKSAHVFGLQILTIISLSWHSVIFIISRIYLSERLQVMMISMKKKNGCIKLSRWKTKFLDIPILVS